jgi:thiamine transporter
MYKNSFMSVRDIALMAMLVAISIVLDQLAVFSMPNGGSVNAAMVGLSLIALSFSPFKTFLAVSIIYGLLTSLLDGYFQYYLFDYFLALSGFAVLSFFRYQILNADRYLSVFFFMAAFLMTATIRLIFAVLSGMIFFEVDFLGSLTYNLTYLIPSIIVTMVFVSLIIFTPLIKRLQSANR